MDDKEAGAGGGVGASPLAVPPLQPAGSSNGGIKLPQGFPPKYMLLEKTKSLYTILQPLLDQFPKSAKFTLRARIENSILDIIKLLVIQNYRQTDDEKKQLMLDVIANIHLTGVLVQQAIIFKYISFGNYEQTFGLIKEITAMAVARRKNLNGGLQ